MMFAAIAAAIGGAHLLGPVAQRMAFESVLRDFGPYRSRGKGRGAPSRRYGNQAGAYSPHQGRQECLRRVVGGWAFSQRVFHMTKAQALRDAPAAPAQVARNALRDRVFA